MKSNQLGKYLKERFPVVNMLLFAILFAAVFSVASFPNNDWQLFGAHVWGGMLAVISFFFRLRVMDEIKDFESDAVLYPGRVLQSGRIQLPFLIRLAALGLIWELVWSILLGHAALLAWAIAVAYSIAMRYEFFVKNWLRERLALYAISHLLIMPAVIAWIWFAYRSDFSNPLYILMALSVLAGFCFEIARKTHAPAAEREGVASYSKSMGLRPAVYSIWALLAVSLLLQAVLFTQLGIGWPALVLLALVFAVLVWRYLIALKDLADTHFRQGELLSSIYMLLSYLVLIVALNVAA